MKPEEFAKGLILHLKTLIPQSQWGQWTYTGRTETAYPTPGGSWQSYEGFEFSGDDHYFILRSIPETKRGSYIVVESHNLEGQLANLRLENRNVFSGNGSMSTLMESFTMTIGHGKRRKEEVRQAFAILGFTSGVITTISDTLPNWNKVLLDILEWSVLRETVKGNLKESDTESSTDSPTPINLQVYTLKSDSLAIRNDVLFGQDSFDISNSVFKFTIYPKCKYWRFGLRFSETEKIDFTPSEPARHLSKDYKDVHLCVGNPPLPGKWENPNRIELAIYNFGEGSGSSNRCDNYAESTPVEFTVRHDVDTNDVLVSYNSGSCQEYDTRLQFGSHRFFQISAWADGIEFEIDFTIESTFLSPEENESPAAESIFIESSSDFGIRNDFDGVIGVKELANELVGLVANLSDDKGNMIGIFGQWGRGKTFLWNRIMDNISARWKHYEQNRGNFWQRMFKKNPSDLVPIKFACVEFHAWKYQDTPASWAYLYESLSDKYLEGNVVTSFCKRLYLNTVRHGYSSILWFVLGLSVSIVSSFVIPFETKANFIAWLFSTLGFVIILKIAFLYFSYKPKAISLFEKYSQKVSFKGYLGLQAEIQKEIVFLLKAWIKKKRVGHFKILIFVDDIDRCDEHKIMAIIDSFKVMLEDANIANRVVVLMAIDERVLKMAVKNKYHDLVNKSLPSREDGRAVAQELEQLAKEYLDKLFIAGIKLGQLVENERKAIFDRITDGRVHFRLSQQLANEKESVPVESKAEITPRPTGQTQFIPDEEDPFPTIILGDAKYEIDESEYYLLVEALHKNPNMTPRAIRIYYYRYLLAKKLIALRFIKGTLIYNTWHSRGMEKSILPNLIVYYSRMETSPKELTEEMRDTNSDSVEILQSPFITKEFFGRSYKVDILLYRELLKIIEMVIPY